MANNYKEKVITKNVQTNKGVYIVKYDICCDPIFSDNFIDNYVNLHVMQLKEFDVEEWEEEIGEINKILIQNFTEISNNKLFKVEITLTKPG